MKNDHLELMVFVLEQAENQPVSRRARLYRALARISGDKKDEASLNNLADHLETSDKLCREFEFSFVQVNTVTAS